MVILYFQSFNKVSVFAIAGNAERGWNDPPVFLNVGVQNKAESTSPRKHFLNKRVAHPGLLTAKGKTGVKTAIRFCDTD